MQHALLASQIRRREIADCCWRYLHGWRGHDHDTQQQYSGDAF